MTYQVVRGDSIVFETGDRKLASQIRHDVLVMGYSNYPDQPIPHTEAALRKNNPGLPVSIRRV